MELVKSELETLAMASYEAAIQDVVNEFGIELREAANLKKKHMEKSIIETTEQFINRRLNCNKTK